MTGPDSFEESVSYDVEVMVKRRLRVSIEGSTLPNDEIDMRNVLENEEYLDITDEENLDFISVTKMKRL